MKGYGERREAGGKVDQRMGKIDVGKLKRSCENLVVRPVGNPEPDQNKCERAFRPRAPPQRGEGEEREGERLGFNPVSLNEFEHTAA